MVMVCPSVKPLLSARAEAGSKLVARSIVITDTLLKP